MTVLFLARLWTSGPLALLILGVALSLSLAVASPARAGQAAKPTWQLEWEKTVEAAKKEGQVSIYTFGGATNLAIDAGVFQKRFPEIKVITATGNPVPRILTERRAEKCLVDIAIGGSATPWDLYLAKALDPIRDAMILPEVVDESKWWRGKHHYIDSERKYALMFIGTPDLGYIFYNTRLVNPKEFQSFWDFLNPKWKGKIAARDIRTPGTGSGSIRMFYHHPKLGPEFIRRFFSDTDLTLFRDRRQGVDWLVTGKFPICFFCPSSDVGTAKRQGFPVDGFGSMKEGAGVASSSGNIGLINKASHPSAARVFLNWFLSREGQLTMQREYSRTMVGVSNSLRVDIPKDMVPPDERLLEGIDYIEVEVAERMSIEPVRKIVNEVLAASGR